MVLFPDVEALLCTWLRTHLPATATVGNKLPNPRPAPFVLVQRHGGTRHTVVTDAAQIGLECWAVHDYEAHDLLQQCRWLLLYCLPGRILDGHVVYRVDEMGGPSNLPDPTSVSPRWVAEFQVHIRGIAAS